MCYYALLMARSIFDFFVLVLGSGILDSSMDMFTTSLLLAVMNISSRFVWILPINFRTNFLRFSYVSIQAAFSAY